MFVLFGITMSFAMAVFFIACLMAFAYFTKGFFAKRSARVQRFFMLVKVVTALYISVFAFWPAVFAFILWNGIQIVLFDSVKYRNSMFSFSFTA